jgi:predicted outer membrane repeat protein
MKLSSVSVSVFLIIVALLTQSQTATTATLNYVTPTDECPDDKTPCYTLEEYANQQATYFTNNSIFCFFPGLHKLEESIRITNTHNLSFDGVLDNEVVIIAFRSAASILWKNCSDIEITSLIITLLDNFTYSIVFEHIHSVKMFNITILGNGNNGCSSILSNMSTINIINSQFIGIHGCLGAAIMITASSNITLTGSNTFKNNVAMNGGAIYIYGSVLITQADGANFFTNNSVKFNRESCSTCNSVQQLELYHGRGGAVYSNVSTLRLTGQSMITFSENKAQRAAGGYYNYYYGGSGGAIAVVNGTFITEVSALFYNNKAENEGGAILLEDVNSKLLGPISFIKNAAEYGGALNMVHTNISFNVDQSENYSSLAIIAFQNNSANYSGGAIESYSSILTFKKSLIFEANTAHDHGGAMSLYDTSKLILIPRLNISK